MQNHSDIKYYYRNFGKRMICSLLLRKTSYITGSIFSSFFLISCLSPAEVINKSDNLFYPVTEFYLTILQHGYLFRDIYFSTIFVDGKKNDRRMFYVRFLLPTSRNTRREKYSTGLSWIVSICFRFVGRKAIEKYCKC